MAGFVDWWRRAMGWVSSVPSSTVTTPWITASRIVGRTSTATAEMRAPRGVVVGRVASITVEAREP